MKILITGASGYIGTALISKLEEAEHEVIAATRTNALRYKNWIHFDLNNFELFKVPENIDLIIHLAANTKNIGVDSQEEIIAAKLLINESIKINAKFIFLSSQASSEYAYSQYGQIKWKIETAVLAANGIVVRPGLVYGGRENGGLFAQLVKMMKKSFILPSFYPALHVQPIHIDDLCIGIIRLFNAKSKIYSLASINPIPFDVFLKEIIFTKKIGLRIFLPVPILLIKIFSCVVIRQSTLGGWLNRLLSLANTILMRTQEDLIYLNLELRDLSIGINKLKGGFRRELLLEGRIFMHYIGIRSKGSYLRRYVRAIESCYLGVPLFMPIIFLKVPCLFSLLNLNILTFDLKSNIQSRIDVATLLSEASIKGGLRIFGKNHEPGFWRKIAFIFWVTLTEFNRKILSIILYPVFKLLLKHEERRVYVHK